MKKILLLFISLLITQACDKKKGSAATSNNSGTTSAHANIMVAKVNGLPWESSPEGYSISKTSTFNFSGQNTPGNPFSAISFALPLTTTLGVSSFSGANTVTGKFKDTLGINYAAKTGTINITELDTFSYGLRKFKATFSFSTDTVGGKTYNISNGVVDFRL